MSDSDVSVETSEEYDNFQKTKKNHFFYEGKNIGYYSINDCIKNINIHYLEINFNGLTLCGFFHEKTTICFDDSDGTVAESLSAWNGSFYNNTKYRDYIRKYQNEEIYRFFWEGRCIKRNKSMNPNKYDESSFDVNIPNYFAFVAVYDIGKFLSEIHPFVYETTIECIASSIEKTFDEFNVMSLVEINENTAYDKQYFFHEGNVVGWTTTRYNGNRFDDFSVRYFEIMWKGIEIKGYYYSEKIKNKNNVYYLDMLDSKEIHKYVQKYKNCDVYNHFINNFKNIDDYEIIDCKRDDCEKDKDTFLNCIPIESNWGFYVVENFEQFVESIESIKYNNFHECLHYSGLLTYPKNE